MDKLTVVLLLGTLTGCDFALQPHNETALLVLESYTDVTGKFPSQDVQDCMRTYVISYVDELEYCQSNKKKPGVTTTGCNHNGLLNREIQVLSSSTHSDLVLSHEYIHSLMDCLDLEDEGATHSNPVFWTCPGSVEWVVADKLGYKKPTNVTYTTACPKV